MDESSALPQPTDSDAWALTARTMAQHAVIAALVRTHPNRDALTSIAQQFAEAHRAMLLASPNATDEHLEIFERSLRRLLDIRLQSDSKDQRG